MSGKARSNVYRAGGPVPAESPWVSRLLGDYATAGLEVAAPAIAAAAATSDPTVERRRHVRSDDECLILNPGVPGPAVMWAGRGDRWSYEPSIALEVGTEPATARRAASKGAGSVLPRFSARRRIPAHAFGLKQYRDRWAPVSKMSDNEQTAPSLGDGTRVTVHSDVLSVQHSPGEAIPEFGHRSEKGSNVPSVPR